MSQSLANLELATSLFNQQRYAQAQKEARNLNALLLQEIVVNRLGEPPFHPEVSVIVLSYGDPDGIDESFKALAEQIRDTWEVIIVDNGSRKLRERSKRAFTDLVYVQMPFNAGCSAGRNVGAHCASGTICLFIDDDGIVQPGCLDALCKALESQRRVAARGRIKPLAPRDSSPPPHYDLGDHLRPSFINGEGVSAFRRHEFLQTGGFNPLLSGHEGIELCGRSYRHWGPYACVYVPDAVLRHDYSDNKTDSKAKREKHRQNKAFVEQVSPGTFALSEAILDRNIHPREFVIELTKSPVDVPQEVCWGIILQLDDKSYNPCAVLQSIESQSHQQFQCLVIDRLSDKEIKEDIASLCSRDPRFLPVTSDLGAAIMTPQLENCDYFLISSGAEVSVRTRLQELTECFLCYPESGLVLNGDFEPVKAPLGSYKHTPGGSVPLIERLLLGVASLHNGYAIPRRNLLQLTSAGPSIFDYDAMTVLLCETPDLWKARLRTAALAASDGDDTYKAATSAIVRSFVESQTKGKTDSEQILEGLGASGLQEQYRDLDLLRGLGSSLEAKGLGTQRELLTVGLAQWNRNAELEEVWSPAANLKSRITAGYTEIYDSAAALVKEKKFKTARLLLRNMLPKRCYLDDLRLKLQSSRYRLIRWLGWDSAK